MDTLRISGFTSRAWAEHAISELTALGYRATHAEGPAGRIAILVSGSPAQLDPLRPLAIAAELEEARIGADFDWGEYVNSLQGLPRFG